MKPLYCLIALHLFIITVISEEPFPLNKSQCFCKLKGRIDDCFCNVESVDHFNNVLIFPRLSSLLNKNYFRYFKYNAHKGCPFWESTLGKCSSPKCHVDPCTPEELPPELSKHHKYSKECNQKDEESEVDKTLSHQILLDIEAWKVHDETSSHFCDIDEDTCIDCDYVDLTRNPERYTGYSGEDSWRIWRAIYEENCFRPPHAEKSQFSSAFLQDRLEKDLCLEKRAFYRAVSGLHTSISIHLCANYPQPVRSFPGGGPEAWGPNLLEFQKRFDPKLTNDQGPYWLKNLYFIYLLEMRALIKASSYLENQVYFTGSVEQDTDTQKAVQEILKVLRSFKEQFDESVMFSTGAAQLKEEFRSHFHNISRVMDCVGCDKCKLWGKLQISGLGTALKVLFSEESSFQLTRNEIVALFNAFGRLSNSIREIEKFRGQKNILH